VTFVRNLIIALAVIEGAWMTYDGSRALTVGDYITPQSGPHAGQLGPWHHLVSAVGVAPRSSLMKIIFVVYGVSWLIIAVGFMRSAPWAWTAMTIAAVGTLWYLPVGTACGIVQIAGLLWLRRAT